MGTTRKKGGLRNWSCQTYDLITDVAQKGVLAGYLSKRGFWQVIYQLPLLFSCQHDQLVGVYSDRLKRGVSGSGSKREVLGTGQARKKGGLRH